MQFNYCYCLIYFSRVTLCTVTLLGGLEPTGRLSGTADRPFGFNSLVNSTDFCYSFTITVDVMVETRVFQE